MRRSTGNCSCVLEGPTACAMRGPAGALAGPENTFAYEPGADVFRLAAAYCGGMVNNQPFIDGNERTGILAAVVFLDHQWRRSQFRRGDDSGHGLCLVASEVTEDKLADWLQTHLPSIVDLHHFRFLVIGREAHFLVEGQGCRAIEGAGFNDYPFWQLGPGGADSFGE